MQRYSFSSFLPELSPTTAMDTIYLFVLCAFLPSAVPWQNHIDWIFMSPNTEEGFTIKHLNDTSENATRYLKWSWDGLDGAFWENRLWYDKNKANFGGGFTFMKNGKTNSGVARLEWENRRGRLNYTLDSELIEQPTWTIEVRDLVTVSFVPLVNNWEFRIGRYNKEFRIEDILIVRGASYEEPEQELTIDRRKRSPQVDDDPESILPQSAGFMEWLNRAWDYLFGSEASRSDGDNDGLFSRFGKWLRGVSCSLHGPCDTPEPTDTKDIPLPRKNESNGPPQQPNEFKELDYQ